MSFTRQQVARAMERFFEEEARARLDGGDVEVGLC